MVTDDVINSETTVTHSVIGVVLFKGVKCDQNKIKKRRNVMYYSVQNSSEIGAISQPGPYFFSDSRNDPGPSNS